MTVFLRSSILKTLIYADIFDYPLTIDEIWKWLIFDSHAELVSASNTLTSSHTKSRDLFHKILKSPPVGRDPAEAGQVQDDRRLSKYSSREDGYYCLPNRKSIVETRRKRKKSSKEKLKIAQRAATILRIIPTIQLVGITGALAMNNADEDDDIDLFIITTPGALWSTRFFVTLLVHVIGMRRVPGQVKVKNKLCLNMYVDADHLAVPQRERNLFTAHEVLQMKPLFDRYNAYYKFLLENKWVKRYLPNAFDRIRNYELRIMNGRTQKIILSHISYLISPLESFLKRFQLWYMRSRRTTEKISDGVIRFHPKDVSRSVLLRYTQSLEKYGK